jgi:hypothetical protein
MDAYEVELERMPAAWSNGADSTQGVRSGRSLLRSVVARLEWKVDREGGAAAFLALDLDPTAMLPDDLPGSRQHDPGPTEAPDRC